MLFNLQCRDCEQYLLSNVSKFNLDIQIIVRVINILVFYVVRKYEVFEEYIEKFLVN